MRIVDPSSSTSIPNQIPTSDILNKLVTKNKETQDKVAAEVSDLCKVTKDMVERNSRMITSSVQHLEALVIDGIHANRFEFEFGNREDRCTYIGSNDDHRHTLAYFGHTYTAIHGGVYQCKEFHCSLVDYIRKAMTEANGKRIIVMLCPMHYDELKRVPFVTIEAVTRLNVPVDTMGTRINNSTNPHTQAKVLKLYIALMRDGTFTNN